jgi:NADH dehydrogenase FAD-containing subunit
VLLPSQKDFFNTFNKLVQEKNKNKSTFQSLHNCNNIKCHSLKEIKLGTFTHSPTQKYDFLIVGAGIIGLTTAYELIQRNPDYRIAVMDKESECGFHASGRNSGILHAGFLLYERLIKS